MTVNTMAPVVASGCSACAGMAGCGCGAAAAGGCGFASCSACGGNCRCRTALGLVAVGAIGWALWAAAKKA